MFHEPDDEDADKMREAMFQRLVSEESQKLKQYPVLIATKQFEKAQKTKQSLSIIQRSLSQLEVIEDHELLSAIMDDSLDEEDSMYTCSTCGSIFEIEDIQGFSTCPSCGSPIE